MQGIAVIPLVLVGWSAGTALGINPVLWIAILMILGPGLFVATFSLFHWIFSTAVSSVFVGLAMEGKATDATNVTPLSMVD